MVADPRRLTRFFFDRNLGHRVPEALRAHGWLVELHDDHFAEETPDEVILEAIAQAGWVLVTQDCRIRKRAAELNALIEHGVRAFFIASTGIFPRPRRPTCCAGHTTRWPWHSTSSMRRSSSRSTRARARAGSSERRR